MAVYRQRRAIESSTIDYLETKMTLAGWANIRFEKAFSRAYDGSLPCIVVNCDPVTLRKLEIGSKTNLKEYELSIRVFSTSDGQRLDIADYLTDLFEDDIPYYNYTITDGKVSKKTLSGKIEILDFLRNEKELTNTENLESIDKFRHLIILRIGIK